MKQAIVLLVLCCAACSSPAIDSADPSSRGIRTTVRLVDTKMRIVVLGVGSKSKVPVKVGYRFIIYRGRTFVAAVRVIDVDDAMCAARLVDPTPKDAVVRAGDNALGDPPPQPLAAECGTGRNVTPVPPDPRIIVIKNLALEGSPMRTPIPFAPSAAIRTTVLLVDSESQIVVLDVGSMNKPPPKKGDWFLIYRGHTFVAAARVINVDGELCAARIVKAYNIVEVGDTALRK